MKCSICHQEGHRSDNLKFHSKTQVTLTIDHDSYISKTDIKKAESHELPQNEIKLCPPTPETHFSEAAQNFIQQARLIHAVNHYDYSYVKYVNCDTKVNIWCDKPTHGMFEKVPYNHIKHKSGCPKCLCETKRLNLSTHKLSEFIEKANTIHNNEYDYSLVNFSTSTKKDKITIGCKKGHPVFTQVPSSHLKGAGCPLCAHKKIADSKRKSNSEFIHEAIKKHGDAYDYSESVYTSSAEPITIKCNREGHPSFKCVATLHLQGQGCPLCTKEQIITRQRLSLDEFIKRSSVVHGHDKYDYSESEYNGVHSRIKIYCKAHREFFTQLAGSHMSGKGCQKCSKEHRIKAQTFTLDEFMDRANKTHGELYDYSDVLYINSQTKVSIVCKKHGSFLQVPNSHLQGYGCNKCAIEKNADNCRLKTSEFLERAHRIHGNKYDYSEVEYASMISKIKIKCNACEKTFYQLPSNHLDKGFGCPHCAGNAIMTTEEFIKKSKAIHENDAFNYSKTNYVRSNQKVTIICNKSNLPFQQTPNSHLSGSGCPCCKPKYSKPQIQYLTFLSVSTPTIQHALNGGEHRIKGSRYSADGFMPETNRIVEFHGCLWHGCPKCFVNTALNPCTKRTFGEEYERTRDRELYIKSIGYSYTDMWECNWKKAISAIKKLQRYWRNKSGLQ